MRIIAGRHRGRKLKAPRGLATRPVLARVREALFNVLGDVAGARVLDLYAGTGALGIEALSRGAASLVAVDSGIRQNRIIRENLACLGEDAEVVRADVGRLLKKKAAGGETFELVFADPPYEKGLAVGTVEAVFGLGLLAAGGVMCVTVRHSETLPAEVDEGRVIFDRRYGETRLVLYKRDFPPRTHDVPRGGGETVA